MPRARNRPDLTHISPGIYLNEDGYYVDRDGSLVYFIRERGGARRIKVGFTTNLPARFAQICTGSSEKLEVIHTEPGGKPREKFFHRIWAPFHYNLEWHNPGQPILDYVDKAPPGRRGRDPFSLRMIPWARILRPLGVTPRGAIRILSALLQLAFVVLSGGRGGRMKRQARNSAIAGAPVTVGSGLAWLQYGPVALWGIVPAVLIACIATGWKK